VRDVDVLAPETEQPEAPQSDAVSLKQKVEKKPKVIRGKVKAKAKAKSLALEDEPAACSSGTDTGGVSTGTNGHP